MENENDLNATCNKCHMQQIWGQGVVVFCVLCLLISIKCIFVVIIYHFIVRREYFVPLTDFNAACVLRFATRLHLPYLCTRLCAQTGNVL